MSNVTFSPPNIYPNSNMNTFSQTGQGGIGVRAPDYLNEMNLETGQYFPKDLLLKNKERLRKQP